MRGCAIHFLHVRWARRRASFDPARWKGIRWRVPRFKTTSAAVYGYCRDKMYESCDDPGPYIRVHRVGVVQSQISISRRDRVNTQNLNPVADHKIEIKIAHFNCEDIFSSLKQLFLFKRSPDCRGRSAAFQQYFFFDRRFSGECAAHTLSGHFACDSARSRMWSY